MARIPRRRGLRPPLPAGPFERYRGGPVQRPGAGPHAERSRGQRRRSADARRPPAGRHGHRRGSRPGLRSDAGCRTRSGNPRRPEFRGRSRRHQTPSRARPGVGRQSQGAAGRRCGRCRSRHRPRTVRTPSRSGDGDDRPRDLHRMGRRAPRFAIAGRHPRHHPGEDRLRRFPDERRHRDGSPQRRSWTARRRMCRGRMRCRASLRREDGEYASGREIGPGTFRGR